MGGPRRLCDWLISLSHSGVLVLDLFAGIGCLHNAIQLIGKKHPLTAQFIADRVFVLFFEVDARCRNIIMEKHISSNNFLSAVEDSEGVEGSSMALVDNDFALLLQILSYVPANSYILFGGGSPCVGFSKTNPCRQGIDSVRSRLCLLVPVLMSKIKMVRPDIIAHFILESVPSSPSDSTGISAIIGVEHWAGDAGAIFPISRPRWFWVSFRGETGF